MLRGRQRLVLCHRARHILLNVVADMIRHSVCLEARHQGRPIDGGGSHQNHILRHGCCWARSDFLREVGGSSNLDAPEAPVSTGTTASGRPSLASLSCLSRFHLSSQFCACITSVFCIVFGCTGALAPRSDEFGSTWMEPAG